MAYVDIPKDLTDIRTKFMGNFTKRQCICFELGILAGFPSYFAVRPLAGTTGAFYVLIALMAPFFLFGIMEKDGLPLEVYLLNYIRHRYVYPQIRQPGCENIYDYYREASMRAQPAGRKGGRNGSGKGNRRNDRG